MVNTIQNAESRSHSVASGRDAAQSPTARKAEIDSDESTSTSTAMSSTTTSPVIGRLLRTRRQQQQQPQQQQQQHEPPPPPSSVSDVEKQTFVPMMVQCKLPLDRINDILSKIKKTEKSDDSLVSDLSVQQSQPQQSQQQTDIDSTAASASSPPSLRLMCLFCDRTFVSNVLLQKHTERSHRIATARRFSSRNVEQTSRERYHPGCNFCSGRNGGGGGAAALQTATNLTALFNHLLDEHAAKYFACRNCEIRFSARELLASHDRDVHGKVANYDVLDALQLSRCKAPARPESDANGDVDGERNCRRVGKRSASTRPKSSDIDIEDSLPSTIIMSNGRANELDKKMMGVDQNAVIVLDNIRVDNKLLKNKGISILSQLRPKAEEKDNQILSRLGIAQNRTSRARSLRRLRKNPHTENRAADAPRKDKAKSKSDAHEFVINKNKNDPSSKFDPDFYSKVGANVRENILTHLDGKLGRRGDGSASMEHPVDAKIKSTHVTLPDQPAEIHGSDASLNAITVFPTLLTSDQYGSDKIPDYSYGANTTGFKKIVLKNSWKWKWDPIKKYKYCNEDGRIVRKIRPLQHVSPRDLSKLDIWTQLTMREKFDRSSAAETRTSDDVDSEKASKSERQKQINELNVILDKRSFPNIDKECQQMRTVSDSVVEEAPIAAETKIETEAIIKSEVAAECGRDTSLLSSLGLVQNVRGDAKSTAPILSGEWARPRCYICCICGRRAECLKLLEAHQASHHPHVHATHYEIVGRELIENEVHKYMYLPGAKRADGFPKATSSSTTKSEMHLKSKPGHGASSPSRPNRMVRTTRSIKSLERGCTKCEKMLPPAEFYRHILECAGDYGWIMAKKKCKYKPFGARKRRPKGLYKREGLPEDERQERQDSKEDRNNVRPKLPPRPRIRPSDAETIQRMLANLPPKRASRQVQEESSSSPKHKTHSPSDRKPSHVRRLLDAAASGKKNKIISSNLINSMKSALGKKVRHITRSLSRNQMPNIDNCNDKTVPKKDVVIPDNTDSLDKNNFNNSKETTDQVKLLDEPSVKVDSSVIDKGKMKNQEQTEATDSTPNDGKNSTSSPPEKTRTRASNSKNDVSSAANNSLEENETFDKPLVKSLRGRPVVSSKIIKNNTKFSKVSLNKENVIAKPAAIDLNADNNMTVSKESINDRRRSSEIKPKKKKKTVKFPLKWIGNKRVHFNKSRRANRQKAKIAENKAEDSSNSKVDQTQEECGESIEQTEGKGEDEDKLLHSQSMPNLTVLDEKSGEIETKSADADNAKTSDCENQSSKTACNEPLSSDALARSVSSQNFSCGSFSSNNGLFGNELYKNNNLEKNNQFQRNDNSKVFDRLFSNAGGVHPLLLSGGYGYASGNRPDEESVVEPIRGPNNAYYTLADNIDKPPLPIPEMNKDTRNVLLYNPERKSLDAPFQGPPLFSQLYPSHSAENIPTATQRAKSSSSKSKRGLNDCIAMLKGKLGGTDERPPPPEVSHLKPTTIYNKPDDDDAGDEEDSQQPLDLSGRIPQPEDLSMKTINSKKVAVPPPPAETPPTINIPKPATKPIYDPILKIPHFSVTHSSAHINIPSAPPVYNYHLLESTRKGKSDFSIPSLLSPDKKIPTPKSTANLPAAKAPINYIKSMSGMSEKLANYPEKRSVHTETTMPPVVVSQPVMKTTSHQSKPHFIDDILSTKKPKKIEQRIEENNQRIVSPTPTIPMPSPIPMPIVESVKPIPEKVCEEVESVNTDLFLIDPVTGMITERSLNEPSVDDAPKMAPKAKPNRRKPNKEPKKKKTTAKNNKINDIVPEESTVAIEQNNVAPKPTEASESKLSDTPAASKRSRRKSSVAKAGKSPKSAETVSTENPTAPNESRPPPVLVAQAIDESAENCVHSAIQQDEISSTQSAINDSANKPPIEPTAEIADLITLSDILIDEPYDASRFRAAKPPPKRRNNKKQKESPVVEPIDEENSIKSRVGKRNVRQSTSVESKNETTAEHDAQVPPAEKSSVKPKKKSKGDETVERQTNKVDKHIQVGSPNELKMKILPENIIINESEFAVTPSTNRDLITNDKISKCENLTKANLEVKDELMKGYKKKDRLKCKFNKKAIIEQSEDSRNSFSNDISGGAVAPGDMSSEPSLTKISEKNSALLATEESDDDNICLAEMAKKKTETSSMPSTENVSEFNLPKLPSLDAAQYRTEKEIIMNQGMEENVPNRPSTEGDPEESIHDDNQNSESSKPVIEDLLLEKTADVSLRRSSESPPSQRKKSKGASKDSSAPKKKANVRKSRRLSTHNNFNTEKIATINSVQLSENGHLIFKMQKDDTKKIEGPIIESSQGKDEFEKLNPKLNEEESDIGDNLTKSDAVASIKTNKKRKLTNKARKTSKKLASENLTVASEENECASLAADERQIVDNATSTSIEGHIEENKDPAKAEAGKVSTEETAILLQSKISNDLLFNNVQKLSRDKRGKTNAQKNSEASQKPSSEVADLQSGVDEIPAKVTRSSKRISKGKASDVSDAGNNVPSENAQELPSAASHESEASLVVQSDQGLLETKTTTDAEIKVKPKNKRLAKNLVDQPLDSEENSTVAQRNPTQSYRLRRSRSSKDMKDEDKLESSADNSALSNKTQENSANLPLDTEKSEKSAPSLKLHIKMSEAVDQLTNDDNSNLPLSDVLEAEKAISPIVSTEDSNAAQGTGMSQIIKIKKNKRGKKLKATLICEFDTTKNNSDELNKVEDQSVPNTVDNNDDITNSANLQPLFTNNNVHIKEIDYPVESQSNRDDDRKPDDDLQRHRKRGRKKKSLDAVVNSISSNEAKGNELEEKANARKTNNSIVMTSEENTEAQIDFDASSKNDEITTTRSTRSNRVPLKQYRDSVESKDSLEMANDTTSRIRSPAKTSARLSSRRKSAHEDAATAYSESCDENKCEESKASKSVAPSNELVKPEETAEINETSSSTESLKKSKNKTKHQNSQKLSLSLSDDEERKVRRKQKNSRVKNESIAKESSATDDESDSDVSEYLPTSATAKKSKKISNIDSGVVKPIVATRSETENERLSKIYDIDEDLDFKAERQTSKRVRGKLNDKKIAETKDVFDYDDLDSDKMSAAPISKFSSNKGGKEESKITMDDRVKFSELETKAKKSNSRYRKTTDADKIEISIKNKKNKSRKRLSLDDEQIESVHESSDVENLRADFKTPEEDCMKHREEIQGSDGKISPAQNSITEDTPKTKPPKISTHLKERDDIVTDKMEKDVDKDLNSITSEPIDDLNQKRISQSNERELIAPSKSRATSHNKRKKSIQNESKNIDSTIAESTNEAPASFKSNKVAMSESDKESLIQEKYLADFGMFTEKRVRKSTIVAIKKINQTFKPDSSDTDDMTDMSSPRQSSRSQRKRSKKSVDSDMSTSDHVPAENEMRRENLVQDKAPSVPNYLTDSESSSLETKIDTYCAMCRRKFRNVENFNKHLTTLTHIARVSEMEAAKNAVMDNETAPRISDDADFGQNLLTPGDAATNSASRPYKNLAERKSFDHEIPSQSFASLSVKNLPSKKDAPSDCAKSDVARKELSRDEALFFECCSLLKESETARKQVVEPEHYEPIEKDSDRMEVTHKKHAKNPVVTYNLTVKNILQASETLPDPFSEEDHSERNSKKSDVEIDVGGSTSSRRKKNKRRSLSKKIDIISSDNDEPDEVFQDIIPKADVEEPAYCPESRIVRTNSNDFSDNADSLIMNKDIKRSLILKEEERNFASDILEPKVTTLEGPSDHQSRRQNRKKSNAVYSSEEIEETSDKNGESSAKYSTVESSTTSISVKENMEKNKPSSTFEIPYEFEDKFDKIKRKAREKAQAAQEAMAANALPNISSRSRKKTHSRARKIAKMSSDSSKSSRVSLKNRRMPKKKNQIKEIQKHPSKKVLTKGARKVFDSIKVSIPTEEINSILDSSKHDSHRTNKYNELDDDNLLSENSASNEMTSSGSHKKADNCLDMPKLGKSPLYSSKYKNSPAPDSDENLNADIYEFYDEDDDRHPRNRSAKSNPPTDATFERHPYYAIKKLMGNHLPNTSKSANEPLQNDDSQISSLSFSDRDDFNYASEEYNQSGEDTNISSHSNDDINMLMKLKKKCYEQIKMLRTKKSAIMGRIFKNNAIRNDQKPAAPANPNEPEEKDTAFTNKSNLDQIFDSLLEKNSSGAKHQTKNDEIVDCCTIDDGPPPILNSCNAANDSGSEFEEDDSDSMGKSMGPLMMAPRKNSRKIMPRLKARSSDDEAPPPPKKATANVGVANRKSQRKCTTGKQNVLVESWSSESDFEDFRQFEEYSSIPKSRHHHRRPRRSRRHLEEHPKGSVEETTTEDTNACTVVDFSKDFVEGTDERLFDKEDDDEEEEIVNLDEEEEEEAAPPPPVVKATTTITNNNKKATSKRPREAIKRRSSTTTLDPHHHHHQQQQQQAKAKRQRRRPAPKPFDYDDEFKPTRLDAQRRPSGAGGNQRHQRNKRSAPEMLYYWSSSSDDDAAAAAAAPGGAGGSAAAGGSATATGGASASAGGASSIEQHGWIVGDSHKKLVTMLAHAKGKASSKQQQQQQQQHQQHQQPGCSGAAGPSQDDKVKESRKSGGRGGAQS